jgi:hypothetical protein
MDVEYDVALSFAGEDRGYVEQVAECLKKQGVHPFYDLCEEASLWGRDLYVHLDDVYRKQARFCVMFISQHYKDKLWTNHERESAQARAFEENREYILPARFDDTEIPGIRPTTGYIDLRGKAPKALCRLILQKLGHDVAKEDEGQSFRKPRVSSKAFNPYDEGLKFIQQLQGELRRRSQTLKEMGVICSSFERSGRTCIRVVKDGKTAYSLDVWMGGFTGDSSLGFYGIPGEPIAHEQSSNAWGNMQHDGTEVKISLSDFSLLGHLSGDKTLTPGQLIDAIWDKVCDELEK